jgi:hypothetical protein
MTDIETTENVFEAKARQIVEKIQRDLFRSDIHPSEARKEHIAAIAAALEAERLEERERCAVTFDEYYRQHVGIDDRRAQVGSDAAAAMGEKPMFEDCTTGLTGTAALEAEMRDRLAAKDARIAELEETLAFYADAETYHAIAFLADPPCGEFMDDFSDDHGDDYDRPMPGRRARSTLEGKHPNAESLAAMQELEDGGGETFSSVDAIIHRVNYINGEPQKEVENLPRWKAYEDDARRQLAAHRAMIKAEKEQGDA